MPPRNPNCWPPPRRRRWRSDGGRAASQTVMARPRPLTACGSHLPCTAWPDIPRIRDDISYTLASRDMQWHSGPVARVAPSANRLIDRGSFRLTVRWMKRNIRRHPPDPGTASSLAVRRHRSSEMIYLRRYGEGSNQNERKTLDQTVPLSDFVNRRRLFCSLV